MGASHLSSSTSDSTTATQMNTVLFITCSILLILIGIIIGEIFIAQQGVVPLFQNPGETPYVIQNDYSSLTYLVLGDSTAAGQGSAYAQGIAVQTAKYLSKNAHVTMINSAISGAITHDIVQKQLNILHIIRPDIVLISIGSNDVIHLTSLRSIKKDTNTIIDQILQKNCHAKIIFTGAADVGASPRFLFPLSWIVTFRAKQVADVFKSLVVERELTFAPILEKTGSIFYHDRSLFASDRFHPNQDGYALWVSVLTGAVDSAKDIQPSHCNNLKK